MGGALLLMSSFLLQNSSQIHTIPKKKSSLLNKFEKNLRITQDVRQIHGKTCGPVRRGARNRSLVNMHRNSPGITQCDTEHAQGWSQNTQHRAHHDRTQGAQNTPGLAGLQTQLLTIVTISQIVRNCRLQYYITWPGPSIKYSSHP